MLYRKKQYLCDRKKTMTESIDDRLTKLPMQHPYSLSKAERLTGEKNVQHLFEEGKSLIAFPLRVVFLPNSTQIEPIRVLFSVPKRRFKRANKRNLLRRRMKEAYRLNKQLLHESFIQPTSAQMIAFTYIANELLPYKLIEKKMQEALHILQEAWVKNSL
jgi:ribonuclease P protein component